MAEQCQACGSEDIEVQGRNAMPDGTPVIGLECSECGHEWGDVDL